MKRIVFPILVLIFLSIPSFVFAYTLVNSQISSDTTWSPSGGVYVIDSGFSVASGTTLTIEPGTIVKAKATWYGGPSIYGSLIARGTKESPIYFTSFFDDSIGGDTDGSGPSDGTWTRWQGLYFRPGSKGEVEYVDISYSGQGGYGYGDYTAIENDGGILNIKNSRIHNNFITISNGGSGSMSVGNGIYNKSGTLSVSDSIIENNVNGIRIDSGSATISNNLIKNNLDNTGYGSGYGVYAYDSSLTLLNNTFVGNKRTAYFDMSKPFIHEGNISEDIGIRGFETSGVINDNSTIHSRDLPIIIDYLTIQKNGTLIIEPGTIIKMSDYYSSGNVVVHGNLIAKGTADQKIYITSLRDDSVGGDTNGDGDVSSPQPRNWNAIYLEAGSTADLDNVVIRYSGYNHNSVYIPGATSIYQRGGKLAMKNSSVTHNYNTAIFQDAGTTTIENSELSDGGDLVLSRGGKIKISNSNIISGSGYGVNNQSGVDLGWWYETKPMQVIDARNNWWGDSSGPYDDSTSTPTGIGVRVSQNVLYKPFLTEPADFSNPPVETLDPVIIIPGIAGSELYNGDDLIWLDLSQTFTDINDQFLVENLNLNKEGESLHDIRIGNSIKKISALLIFNQNIFEDLQENLEINGYEENRDLFFFPYDWRLDLNETKNLLRQKIEEIKTQTGKEKVSIVAHSMGGLLTKAYLEEYGKDSVNKLIFVGTPHLGAPKAGKLLLEGDRLSIPWLEEDRLKEIAENSPALHELLPNPKYFSYFQGYLRNYKLFGENPLMDYISTKNFFLNEKAANSIMFQKAEDFNNKNLDIFNFDGIETYNITGCKTPTQAAYSFGIGGGIAQTGYTSGDGTVPIVSAEYIRIPPENKYYVKNGEHAELPSTNGVRDLILGILNNYTSNLPSSVSNDYSFCDFKGKKLTWHSPVEIHVYDSHGNHTGPIENNAIEYGVPNIDYDVMGHDKFIFLPTEEGKEYRVEAKGLEEGTFDLSISEVENGENTITQVFNDVPIALSSVVNFSINGMVENDTIELSNAGFNEQIKADSVLEGDLAMDSTLPETVIILNGKEYKDGEFKKEVEVTFEANDLDSGILSTWYSINNRDFHKYTGPFIIGEEGVFNLRYYSVDRAGNNEEIKYSEVLIGKLSKYVRNLE